MPDEPLDLSAVPDFLCDKNALVLVMRRCSACGQMADWLDDDSLAPHACEVEIPSGDGDTGDDVFWRLIERMAQNIVEQYRDVRGSRDVLATLDRFGMGLSLPQDGEAPDA